MTETVDSDGSDTGSKTFLATKNLSNFSATSRDAPSMKCFASLSVVALCALSSAQTVTNVRERERWAQFPVKPSQAQATVYGPIYKQSLNLNYENPYPALTEAILDFTLPDHATLSAFGYYFKDEYVPGRLMDKQKAWHIYTGITQRNEDPGIATQKSPSDYHIQIYPLEPSWDLRVNLDSIGFTEPPTALSVPAITNLGSPIVPQTAAQSTPSWGVSLYAETHDDGFTYVAGRLDRAQGDIRAQLQGMSDVYWMRAGGSSSRHFVGRKRGAVVCRLDGVDRTGRRVFRWSEAVRAGKGNDVARLWAHQKLSRWELPRQKEIVAFSLKYGVPSSQTALLAVPEAQMEQFRKLDAEFRARQRQREREKRNWQSQRSQNWARSSGGDPELRIELPGALEATAMLPDGRAFSLRPTGGNFWGGNYDVPAQAKEGIYEITIKVLYAGGRSDVKIVKYAVDRTPPKGRLVHRNGGWELVSEPKLARVTAVLTDERELAMEEVSPGRYALPKGESVEKLILMDDAHNLTEVAWSSR